MVVKWRHRANGLLVGGKHHCAIPCPQTFSNAIKFWCVFFTKIHLGEIMNRILRIITELRKEIIFLKMDHLPLNQSFHSYGQQYQQNASEKQHGRWECTLRRSRFSVAFVFFKPSVRLCERGARLKEQIQKSGEGMERAIVLLLFAQCPGESFVLSTLRKRLLHSLLIMLRFSWSFIELQGDKLNETATLEEESCGNYAWYILEE